MSYPPRKSSSMKKKSTMGRGGFLDAQRIPGIFLLAILHCI